MGGERGNAMPEDDDSLLLSDLVDLAHVDLNRLAELPESALAESLRRIFRESRGETEPMAGFKAAPALPAPRPAGDPPGGLPSTDTSGRRVEKPKDGV